LLAVAVQMAARTLREEPAAEAGTEVS
jgi:hypothetical protein